MNLYPQDEMNLKILKFQNQKLAERLEDMKVDEEKMREQLEGLQQQRESDMSILSVINRHWIQVSGTSRARSQLLNPVTNM